MVVATIVVIEHLFAGGGHVAFSDGCHSQRCSLRAQSPANPFGGLLQGLRLLGAIDRNQARHPFSQWALQIDQCCLPHLLQQGGGNAATAHLWTFGLEPNRGLARTGVQGECNRVLKVFGAGLGRQTQTSEAAAPVVGQAFEVDHR